MATGAAVAVVGGTALKIAADRKAAKAKARAARAEAGAKRAQAFELLERFEINADALRQEGEQFKATQIAIAAGTGLAEKSLLTLMEDTNRKITREISNQRREAEFKADQVIAGADIDTKLAGDIKSASRLQTIGTFLQGASRLSS